MDSKKILVSTAVLFLIAGCASVPMESKEKSDTAKKFSQPSSGNAGLYIYRNFGVGGALKKDITINGKCIGESAPSVFFYEEVKGDAEYTISTESEFSPNDLVLKVAAGVNYFVRQFIKMGLFVGGAGLEVVSEEEGKKEISSLGLANKGTCSG